MAGWVAGKVLKLLASEQGRKGVPQSGVRIPSWTSLPTSSLGSVGCLQRAEGFWSHHSVCDIGHAALLL